MDLHDESDVQKNSDSGRNEIPFEEWEEQFRKNQSEKYENIKKEEYRNRQEEKHRKYHRYMVGILIFEAVVLAVSLLMAA